MGNRETGLEETAAFRDRFDIRRIPGEAAMTKEEAVAKYGPPDAMGHVTRFTDSSLRDFVCVLCGADDGYLIGGRGGLNEPCKGGSTES